MVNIDYLQNNVFFCELLTLILYILLFYLLNDILRMLFYYIYLNSFKTISNTKLLAIFGNKSIHF